MAKKSAAGSRARGTVTSARRTPTGHTPPNKIAAGRDATANNPDTPDDLELGISRPSTALEREAVRSSHQRARLARTPKDAVEVELAAPTRVHQPVKESGFGTPSADARPGRSSFSQVALVDDDDELAAMIARRAKGRIKVQATQTGYYDNIRRRPGEVFYLTADGSEVTDKKTGKVRDATPEDAFSSRWMRRVHDKTPISGTKGPNQVIQERHDEILGKRLTSRADAGTGRTSARRGSAADEDVIGADD